MEFRSAEKVKQHIEQNYAKEGSGLLIVYGEKGFGKSTLLRKCVDEMNGIYYAARPASDRLQVQFILEQKRMEAPYTYEGLFQALAQHYKKKTLLVIDDFEYFLKNENDFAGSLQNLLAHGYSATDFLVILCSSSMGFATNSLGKKIGVCKNFLRGVLKWKEASYDEMRSLYPDISSKEVFLQYAMLGGRPQYYQIVSPHNQIKEYIKQMYLQEEAPLRLAGLDYVGMHLREPSVYSTILYYLATGHNKLNDLYHLTGFSRAKISVYVKNLMELDFVEKVYSYGASARDDSQKGIYRISHPILLFWYAFVYEHYTQLCVMSADEFYDEYIEPRLIDYWNERLRVMVSQGVIEDFAKWDIRYADEWIGKSGTIPIIAVGSKKQIPIFCRYDGNAITPEDLQWYLFTARKAKLDFERICIYGSRLDELMNAEKKIGDIEIEYHSFPENQK